MIDMSMALVGEKDKNGRVRILYPNPDVPRTRYIWYGGCKYRRTAEYHGSKIYIVQFIGEAKMQIEYASTKEQYIVDVDDEKFVFTECKNY